MKKLRYLFAVLVCLSSMAVHAQNYINSNEFYLQVGCDMGCLKAVKGGIGGFISNVNIEGNGLFGLEKSEEIFWSDKTGETAPIVTTYKPLGGSVKLGYGIRVHNRIRLTPQVGCQYVTLKESTDGGIMDFDYTYGSASEGSIADGANAASLALGLRCDFAVGGCFGLSITPEYLVGVKKSEGYEVLAGLSSKIKSFSEGFNCNVSINIHF